MKLKLLFLIDFLRTTFWFVPALMSSASMLLALVMIRIDEWAQSSFDGPLRFSYTGGAEGARGVLSTIASSMISVTGIVFSITIVALTLASSQCGPRLLRNFIRDRANQIVLGTFISTFIFCLLVLRTIRSDSNGDFVPGISVVVGVALSIFSLGVLIYFIHHVATAIQVPNVVLAVYDELCDTIDRIFPEQSGKDSESAALLPQERLPVGFESSAGQLFSQRSGYLLAVDGEELLRAAKNHSLVIELRVTPGRFIVEGDRLARIWSAEPFDEEVTSQVHQAFEFGGERTLLQDVALGVEQLVEVAVRALSPGVNDPFTAVNCIDRLTEAFCRIVRRPIPSPYRYDDEQQLRVVAHGLRLADLLDLSLHQIREYGRDSSVVMIRLMESLRTIARNVRHLEDLADIERHAGFVLEGLGTTLIDDRRQEIKERHQRVKDEISRRRDWLHLERPQAARAAGGEPSVASVLPTDE